MSPPVLPRAHVEALLVAHVLLDPELLDTAELDELCATGRLSHGCRELLTLVDEHEPFVRVALVSVAHWTGDEYAVRLARRTEQLRLSELAEWTRATVVGLALGLPRLGTPKRARPQPGRAA